MRSMWNNLRGNKFGHVFGPAGIVVAALVLVAVGSMLFMTPRSQAAGGTPFGAFIDGYRSHPNANVWQKVDDSAVQNRAVGIPVAVETIRLDKDALATVLRSAPHESVTPLRDSQTVLPLPMPDGSFSDFKIQEAPILEASLAAAYPEIKTYRAISIDDPTMTARFDLTPLGFHAMLLDNNGASTILPADSSDETLYASYRSDETAESIAHSCQTITKELEGETPVEESRPQVPVGPTLRTYRFGITATWEYADTLGGGNTANTIASIGTFVNGLNEYMNARSPFGCCW